MISTWLDPHALFLINIILIVMMLMMIIGLFLKIVFLQDPDETTGANEGGPRFAQEPPQHDERAPRRVQAGDGHATLGA